MSTLSTMGASASASSWAEAGAASIAAAASTAHVRICLRLVKASLVLGSCRLRGERAAALVLPIVEGPVLHAHLDRPLRPDVAADERLGEGVLDVALDRPAQRA